MAIWIIPSYLEFIHVAGIHIIPITLIMYAMVGMFIVTHRRFLTQRGIGVPGKFYFCWIVMIIFNLTVKFMCDTVVNAYLGTTTSFQVGTGMGLALFIAILSYAMAILIFYEPSSFDSEI